MKILIVDDSPENLKLLDTILVRQGHHVVQAENGQDALDCLQVQSFDLIISDILMPVMDGFQFCQKVKRNSRFRIIPFIFYTASYRETEDEELALKMGADLFLRKPMRPREFLKKINEFVEDLKGGMIETHAPEVSEEKEVLKLYNERLVRKLEEKIAQLELQVIERVEAQKALMESEERFKALFEYAPDGYFLTDLKGTFMDGNRTAESLIGYKREELIGKNYLNLKLISPKQFFKAAALLEKNRRGQATGPDEFTLKRSDGGRVTVEIWTYPLKIKDTIWVLGSARDISERLRAQETVARSEEKFSKAFQSSPEPMLITTLDGGRFLEVNRSFETIFGYSRNRLIGRTVYDINFWEKPGERDRLLLLLSDKGPVQNRSFAFRSKSGDLRNCLISIDKIKIEGEDCLLSVIQDVTEKRRVEEQLQAYQENLKSLSSELTLAEERERRRLAVNLHDQISQPLAMAKIKLAGLPNKEMSASISEEIEEAKSFLSAAIDRSRILTHELSPPILHEMGLSAAVRWRLDQIGQQTDLETYFGSKGIIPDLNKDLSVLLFRTINELLNNAIKHAQAGWVKVNLTGKTGSLLISVSDNGVGFDMSGLEEHMIRQKKFGLFSIRERLDYFHGKMEVISRPGAGTEIKVIVPLE